MRHDSVFYDLVYPDVEVDPSEEKATEVKADIVFNDNVVFANLDEIKATDNPGMYKVKVTGKQDYIDIPELSIVAHLDEVQTNIEAQIEIQELVKAKQKEIDDMPVTDSAEPETTDKNE